MATIKRKGYGQVEPNHLSGIVTGQIYAQLPAKVNTATEGQPSNAITQLEQGQFAKYDYAAGEVNFTGDGEFMLVYNEEKLYDERKQSHKDFVYKVEDFTDGKMYPRLIKTNVGDIFTTNTFGANTSDTAETTGVAISEGNYLTPGTTGFLEVIKSGSDAASSLSGVTGMAWKVVKIYTMPDGQAGVKIQRVQ
jgi:hypothetical protein